MNHKSLPLEVYMGTPDGQRPLLRLFIQQTVAKKKPEVLLFEELIDTSKAKYSSSFHVVTLSRKKEGGGPGRRGHPVDPGTHSAPGRDPDPWRAPTSQRWPAACARPARRPTGITANRASTIRTRSYYRPVQANDGPAFLAADEPFYLIAAEQGSGKSALVCHWAEQKLGLDSQPGEPETSPDPRQNPTFAVLLVEASRAHLVGDAPRPLERWLQDSMRLDPGTSVTAYLERALSKAPAGHQIVLIIDAVNECEGASVGMVFNRRRLLEACIDLASQCHGSPALRGRVKIVATLRWEAFAAMGYPAEQFALQYEDRAALFYRQKGAMALFEEIPPVEIGQIYEKMRALQSSLAPRFPWEEIPLEMQRGLTNPMLLRVFMKAYDGCAITDLQDYTVRGFKKRLIDRLFIVDRHDESATRQEKIARAELVHAMIKEMMAGTTQHLILDSRQADRRSNLARIMSMIGEHSRVAEDGSARFNAYEDLKDQQIIQEGLVDDAGDDGAKPRKIKRIGFTHELVTALLVSQRRKLESDAFRMPQQIINRLLYAFGMAVTLFLITAWIIADEAIRIPSTIFLGMSIFVLPLHVKIVYQSKRFVHKILDERYPTLDLIRAYEGFLICRRTAPIVISFMIISFLLLVASFAVTFTHYMFHKDVLPFSSFGLYLIPVAVIWFYCVLFGAHFVTGAESASTSNGRFLKNMLKGREAAEDAIESGLNFLLALPLFLYILCCVTAADLYLQAQSLEPSYGINFLAWAKHIVFWCFISIVSYNGVRFGVFYLLLWWQNRQVKQGRHWPADPERFRQTYPRILRAIGLPSLAAIMLLVTFLYTPSWDFGGIRIEMKASDAIRVGGGDVLMVVLSPEKLGTEQAAASITSLEPLNSMAKSIRILGLKNTGVHDLSPVGNLKEIVWLALFDNPEIMDWRPLAGMNTVITLDLGGENVDDRIWAPIQQMGMLRQLDFRRANITDPRPLERLVSLEFLTIEDSKILTEWQRYPIAPSLRELTIKGVETLQLPDLSGWKNLESIELWNPRIDDFSPLLTAPALKEIRVGSLKDDDGYFVDPRHVHLVLDELRARGIEVYVSE